MRKVKVEIEYAVADSKGVVREENMGQVKAFDSDTGELICSKPTKRTKNEVVRIILA